MGDSNSNEMTEVTHNMKQLSIKEVQDNFQQVLDFDIPVPRLGVTKHQAAIYYCGHYFATTTATFPEGLNAHVQCGKRIRAAAVHCNVQQLIPEDRVYQHLRHLFGATNLYAASVTNWVKGAVRTLAGVVEHILARLTEGGVQHLDETGLRFASKLHWLHSSATGTVAIPRS